MWLCDVTCLAMSTSLPPPRSTFPEGNTDLSCNSHEIYPDFIPNVMCVVDNEHIEVYVVLKFEFVSTSYNSLV